MRSSNIQAGKIRHLGVTGGGKALRLIFAHQRIDHFVETITGDAALVSINELSRKYTGGDYAPEIQSERVVLKIAPDLEETDLEDILEVALEVDVAGIIATNTTLDRQGLRHPHQQESGGLSGVPLRSRSNEVIAKIHRFTEGTLPVIGVGGVRDARDVRAKLEAGAVLVQMYTGLVYEGPRVAGRILRRL